jgi:hypothetical protein
MSITGAIGALVQGRQERNAIDVQRDIEQFNIKTETQNAALVAQQTSAREEQQRRESRQLLGTQRAAIGQSGVGYGGSSADIIRQSTVSAELDSLNVRYAGDLERMGILNSIEMRKFNDANLKHAGKVAMRMRWVNAVGAFLGSNQMSRPNTGGALDGPSAYGQSAFAPQHGWASNGWGAYGGYGTKDGPSTETGWQGNSAFGAWGQGWGG